MRLTIQRFKRAHVTEDILSEAARLFSQHYGIWSRAIATAGAHTKRKPGGRVRMSASRLRAECFPDGSRGSFARVTVDGVLAGHAIACRWQYRGQQVCWITQLVVHRDFRRRGLATMLLLALRDEEEDDVFGVLSSHPAACKTLAKAYGRNFAFPQVALDFAKEHAAGIMAASPVGYVKGAKLRGSLYQPPGDDTSGLVSGADTDFFVDHQEPLDALAWLKGRRGRVATGRLAGGT